MLGEEWRAQGLRGICVLGSKWGLLIFLHTHKSWLRGPRRDWPVLGVPVWAQKGPFSSQDRVSLTAWVVC